MSAATANPIRLLPELTDAEFRILDKEAKRVSLHGAREEEFSFRPFGAWTGSFYVVFRGVAIGYLVKGYGRIGTEFVFDGFGYGRSGREYLVLHRGTRHAAARAILHRLGRGSHSHPKPRESSETA
jgi:hypothetical protein